MTRTLHRRGGFTLIEVLVAAGLSMLIMALVTQMMARGIDTLSQLKSVTELSQRLRTFEGVMRNDLAADHFEGRNGARVGDYPLPRSQPFNATTNLADWRSPAKGFFSIRHELNANFGLSTREGVDADGNISSRATGHILHMTVKQSATRGDKVFTAQLPATVVAALPTAQQNALSAINLTQMANQANAISSSWAEVVYFLDTTDASMGKTPGGTPLYGLYRRVRIIPEYGTASSFGSWKQLLDNGTLTAADRAASQALSFSPQNVSGNNHLLNDPEKIRNPLNRLGGINASRTGGPNTYDRITRELDSNNPATAAPTGSDLLLCDVLSFEIEADWDWNPDPISMMYLRPGTQGNPAFPQFNLSSTFEFPFSDLPLAVQLPPNSMTPPTMNPRNTLIGANRVFDTWYETTGPNSWTGQGHRDAMPLPIRMRAVQIKVRVWDRHNNMARQVTIIHEL